VEGEYIKELSASYENFTSCVSNIKLTIYSSLTGESRIVRTVTIVLPSVLYSSIKLENVACLTGYGGNCCNGLGA